MIRRNRIDLLVKSAEQRFAARRGAHLGKWGGHRTWDWFHSTKKSSLNDWRVTQDVMKPRLRVESEAESPRARPVRGINYNFEAFRVSRERGN